MQHSNSYILTFLIGNEATLYMYFLSSLNPPVFPAFAASFVKSSRRSLKVTLAPTVYVRVVA